MQNPSLSLGFFGPSRTALKTHLFKNYFKTRNQVCITAVCVYVCVLCVVCACVRVCVCVCVPVRVWVRVWVRLSRLERIVNASCG